MGRNNKNIKIQLNNRIDELLRIGQRKIKEDRTNSNRAEGIHSIRSAETYRSVGNNFAEYLKVQHIMINNGIDIKAVSAHLGHCNIGITGDIYGHIFEVLEGELI